MSEPQAGEGHGEDDAAADATAGEGFQRTSPISVFFLILEGLKAFVPAMLAFVVFSNAGRLALVLSISLLAAGSLAVALLRWVSFAYRFDHEEMVLRSGILSRNERHVPYHRFQNIDLEQNPLHRLLGVAKVRLETASGGKPEAVISVLRLPEVEVMRTHVFSPRRPRNGAATSPDDALQVPGTELPEARAAEEEEREILRNGVKDLTLLGLISNKGLLVVAAVLGLTQQFGGLDDPELWRRWFGGAGEWIGTVDVSRLDPGVAVLYGLLLVAVFLALTRVLSIAWMLVTLWGFRLARRGEDMRTSYGLITRITATIPRHRVQLLSWHESMIHQWTGTASVKVETAGGGMAGGDDSGAQQMPGNASRLWLAPIVRTADLQDFFTQVASEFGDPERLDWRPISRRAWPRILRRHSIVLCLFTVATAVGLAFTTLHPAHAGLLLFLLPVLGWRARRWAARTAYAIDLRVVAFRSGAFGRHTSVVPLGKIQVVQFQQNPFDRRAVMATVKVDTAGANLSNHRVVIPYLELDEARHLAADLERHASETSFRW